MASGARRAYKVVASDLRSLWAHGAPLQYEIGGEFAACAIYSEVYLTSLVYGRTYRSQCRILELSYGEEEVRFHRDGELVLSRCVIEREDPVEEWPPPPPPRPRVDTSVDRVMRRNRLKVRRDAEERERLARPGDTSGCCGRPRTASGSGGS